MQFKMQKHFSQNNLNAKITGKIQLKKIHDVQLLKKLELRKYFALNSQS